MTRLRIGLGVLLAAAVVAGPLLYTSYRSRHLRNVRVVRPGVLYRAGQLTPAGLDRVVRDHGIRTVVSLRDADVPGQTPQDAAEEAACRGRGLNYVRITPRPWDAGEGCEPPGMIGVRQFLATLDDPANHPVLVHCFAGMHRTGVHCAVFRMEYDRWPSAAAIHEMRHCGYVNIHREDDVRGFLEGYRPRWRGGD